MFTLKCAYQTYAWGKPGVSSEVFKLLSSASDQSLNLESRYAELWMGTHVSGPSTLLSTEELLSDYLLKHPESLGKSVQNKFGQQLPFLFKVLSVDKALSIQAHPNKKHAEELHAARPDLYRDPNHKPEMAVALTQFEALCGFRPVNEVVAAARIHPELNNLLQLSPQELNGLESLSDAVASTMLQKCFGNLMRASPEAVAKQLKSLTNELQNGVKSEEDCVFLRLVDQFPGDAGCLCVYLLNRVVLQPGEAIFLEANLPHAYLDGDCVEIMACSDNVVRAGLTPKYKDVDTLVDMLDYTGKTKEQVLFHPVPDKKSSSLLHYHPPVPDFALDRLVLNTDHKSIVLDAMDSACLLLCIHGSAILTSYNQEVVSRGSVMFVSAGNSVKVDLKDKNELILFRAYCCVNE